MELPNFLCIGAQKAGTSWLHTTLLEHPRIFMPPVNELHFFDRVDKSAPIRKRQIHLASKEKRREESRGAAADADYLRYLDNLLAFETTSLAWYQAAYSWPVASDVRRGDITPSYLELDEKQVAYARDVLGPAKIILVLRRPLDRLLSQLRMWATRDDRDDAPQTEKEWMELFAKMTGRTERGNYRAGIPLWSSYFGASNMLILPFSDIRTDPHRMIARIEDHLGIDRYEHYPKLTKKIHATRKLDIPDAVVAAAAELTAGEDDYIRKAFGEEFLRKTS